ncbi:MAG: hypothetical protein IT449_10535 [Phycisphaerales bacterium]|nr:hypothetical protein [Phycisphaerales bacterium]
MFALLAFLPGRTAIAPQVESDYCYSLLAAERFAEGKGLTSLDPVAPFQPWDYRADFAFLTKWPVGYPLLVWLVRLLVGGTTLQAASWLAVACCASALVGWFAWTWRLHTVSEAASSLGNLRSLTVAAQLCGSVSTSGRWTSILAGLVVASCSVSAGGLLHPRTDTIVTAALPWLLLLAAGALRSSTESALDHASGSTAPKQSNHRARHHAVALHGLLGLLCGSLVWIRYAAVFVPLGAGAIVVCMTWRNGRTLRPAVAFIMGGAAPIFALLAINHAWGVAEGVQSSLNLGQGVRARMDPALLLTGWRTLTDFGFYAHRPEARWLCAGLPIALAIWLPLRSGRRLLAEVLGRVEVALGLGLVITLLVELVLATALFGTKYDYVSLGRYYEPVRPLLLSLCIAGAVSLCRREPDQCVRLGTGESPAGKPVRHSPIGKPAPHVRTPSFKGCYAMGLRSAILAALVVLLHWNATHAWPQSYRKWRATPQEHGPSGAWAQAFSPGAPSLYARLAQEDPHELILFSNFHEFLSFETHLPTYPLPPDVETARRWVSAIADHRGISQDQVFFIFDPDNRWRSAWQPDMAAVVDRLNLVARDPPTCSQGWRIFEFRTDQGMNP